MAVWINSETTRRQKLRRLHGRSTLTHTRARTGTRRFAFSLGIPRFDPNGVLSSLVTSSTARSVPLGSPPVSEIVSPKHARKDISNVVCFPPNAMLANALSRLQFFPPTCMCFEQTPCTSSCRARRRCVGIASARPCSPWSGPGCMVHSCWCFGGENCTQQTGQSGSEVGMDAKLPMAQANTQHFEAELCLSRELQYSCSGGAVEVFNRDVPSIHNLPIVFVVVYHAQSTKR